MKAYNHKIGDFEDEYIGCWYSGQIFPQPISLHVPGKGDAYITYNPNIGSGCSPDQFHNRERLFSISLDILSLKERDYILKSFQSEIAELQNSYEEKWDGNNYVGYWNEKLIINLELELLDFIQLGENELEWVDEEK